MRMRTVYVDAEQKNAKQNNRSWLERMLTVREYQNFLEKGKLVVGVKNLIWPSRTLANVMGEYFANEIVQSCGKGYETEVTKTG